MNNNFDYIKQKSFFIFNPLFVVTCDELLSRNLNGK